MFQSTEAERLQQQEIERQILPIKALQTLVLLVGLGLLSLTYPWRDVVPTALVGAVCVAFIVVGDRRAASSSSPLLWRTSQQLFVVALLAVTISWSGGPASAALPMTIPSALITGIRFPLRWMVPVALTSVAMIVAGLVAGGADALRDNPLQGLSWVAAFGFSTAMAQLLARAERNARRDAVHDALTGVLNRTALESRLAGGTSRRAATISVIALDLDGFKAVNDTYGHDAGDTVLRAIAEVLRAAIRDEDVAYRLGGDEFLIVLPETPPTEAATLAERLRTSVRNLRPDGHTITVSAGVAGVIRGRVDLEHLISRADGALYAAKAAGRDRVEAAEPVRPSAVRALA